MGIQIRGGVTETDLFGKGKVEASIIVDGFLNPEDASDFVKSMMAAAEEQFEPDCDPVKTPDDGCGQTAREPDCCASIRPVQGLAPYEPSDRMMRFELAKVLAANERIGGIGIPDIVNSIMSQSLNFGRS